MEDSTNVVKMVGFAQALQEGKALEFLNQWGLLPAEQSAVMQAVNAQQILAIMKAVCAVMVPVCSMVNANTLTEEKVDAILKAEDFESVEESEDKE